MTISCCSEEMRAKSFSDPSPHGLLSAESDLDWPAGYVAAVSKVLDDASIPNLIWGDFLNALWDSPFIVFACGYIVPSNKFYAAISAITAAGISPCPCESLEHNATRHRTTSVLVHFVVPDPYVSQTIYICPSHLFLDFIPFTPAHPNPADLQFVEVELALRASDPSCRILADTYKIKVLTISSLQKLLLLLSAFQPGGFSGFIFTFDFYLLTIYQTHPVCGGLNSRSLEELRASAFKDNGTWERRQKLEDNVKNEWSSRITPVGGQ